MRGAFTTMLGVALVFGLPGVAPALPAVRGVVLGPGQLGQTLTVQITMKGGAIVNLVAKGNPMTGSGAMTYGTSVTYPMTVTGVQLQGNYIILEGMVQGSKSLVAYKLYFNRTNNNAFWSIPSWGGTIPGSGTATFTP